MHILQVPHPILRKKAKKIEKITPEIKKLAKDMLKILDDQGIALAANQVGQLKRLIVLKFESKNKEVETIPETILINPQVIWQSKEKDIAEEGCLSFMDPEIRAEVKRAKKVKVKAQDISGKEVIVKKEGLFARALQHEIDHLEGILFIDRANPETIYKIEKEQSRIAKEKQKYEML